MEVYTIVIYDEADAEFSQAAQWYKGGNEKIGIEFIKSVKEQLQSIQNYPERYPYIKREIPANFNKKIFLLYCLFYRKKRKENLCDLNFSPQEKPCNKISQIIRFV